MSVWTLFFVRIPYLDTSNRMDTNSACLWLNQNSRMDKKQSAEGLWMQNSVRMPLQVLMYSYMCIFIFMIHNVYAYDILFYLNYDF